jgi:hypothetical protein
MKFIKLYPEQLKKYLQDNFMLISQSIQSFLKSNFHFKPLKFSLQL